MQFHEQPSDVASSTFAPVPAFEDSLVLVRRAQGGDHDALNQLFERYYDRIYRIVRIRMGARLRGVLESCDIVQQTCAVAARKIDSFEPKDGTSLIRWLARIAENQIHDEADKIRTEKRDTKREVALDAKVHGMQDSHPGLQLAAGGASPSSIVANNELKEIYDACVESLPDSMRELILLREYAGASWATVVKELELPNEHAAQEAYRRAQIKLAGILRKRLRH
jgi:RNA polymerase sigma-70 factor (subfamily 1)